MSRFASIIIDFDSTLIQVESLEELAAISLAHSPRREERLGAITELTNQAMSGTLRFDEALKRRISLLEATRNDLRVLVEVLRGKLTPSFERNAAWFRRESPRLYVVSGGFKEFIAPALEPFGFQQNHIYANTFVFDDNGAIIGADENNPLSQEDGKSLLLETLALPRPRLIIGDGFSDYQLRASGACDQFFALVENVHRAPVAERADRVLASFDEIVQEDYF
jgi:D-3-phosphoglycerate dehydrogenase